MRVSPLNNDGAENIIPVSYLIASGSLTSIATFDAVGLIQDNLFIYYIDIKWELRARKLGFQCLGVGNALLQYSLGEQIRFILGKSYYFHSPLRYYYRFRNGIWFHRQPYLSVIERIGGYSRLIKRFIVCALFAGPHQENLYMILKGVVHGMTGRLGKH